MFFCNLFQIASFLRFSTNEYSISYGFPYLEPMKINNRLLVFLVFIGLFSFTSADQHIPDITHDSRLLANSWYALSAEKEACYLQTYRLATWQLEMEIKNRKPGGKPFAIVTDLDETALDNSAWSIKVLLEGKDYPDYWSDWEKAAKAPALPGAIGFFKRAQDLQVPVFYISNRLAKNLGGTISNLKNLGFPNADSVHIMLKVSTSNKVERRNQVLKNHEIVMLLGDNLADFDGVWEEAEAAKRSQSVKDLKSSWGEKFIIFPNPMYGAWKDALFQYKRNIKPEIVDSVWKSQLKDYLKQYEF